MHTLGMPAWQHLNVALGYVHVNIPVMHVSTPSPWGIYPLIFQLVPFMEGTTNLILIKTYSQAPPQFLLMVHRRHSQSP